MAKAVDNAYDAIRDGILNGAYKPGAHITAQQLAEASGLSRTPVREAMRRLAAEGLIRLIPNRGAFVSSWSDDDIEQIYELRVLLESFAAQTAAMRITEDQLVELKAVANEMGELVKEPEPDVDRIAECNDRFHKGVLDASGNRRLRDLLGAIVELPLVLSTFRRYTVDEMQRRADEHADLIAALETRNADWARSVMTSHIRSAQHTLLSPTGLREIKDEEVA